MIVIVYPQFHAVGGIARYLDAFLSNLPAQAPELVLITADEPAAVKRYPGVRLVHLGMPPGRLGLLLWSWRARRCVAALHRSQPLQAVNLHLPPLIPGLFLAGDWPLVLTAHTTYLGMSGRLDGNRHFASPWHPLALWLKLRMEHAIFARADAVITLTEQGRQELARYGRDEAVSVLPNGVDLGEFVPDPLIGKDIDVIFSGRIERRKGSRPMVALCRALVRAQPGIRIAIVGFGDDEAHVWRELAGLPDNVLLTGKVSFADMVACYQRSRVYVSTSYYEGLPGTCLEAMAMGLPVAVWDQLFYRGLVAHDGNGLLAATNDIEALAAAVGRLLADAPLRQRLGEAGRRTVRERYDWRRLAVQLLAVQTHLPCPDTAAGVTP